MHNSPAALVAIHEYAVELLRQAILSIHWVKNRFIFFGNSTSTKLYRTGPLPLPKNHINSTFFWFCTSCTSLQHVEVHALLRLRKRKGKIKDRWELLEDHCIEDSVRITQLSDPQS